MDIRQFLAKAEREGWVEHIRVPVDPYIEMARVIHALGEKLTVFSAVGDWPGRIVAGLCSRRQHLALALGVAADRLLPTLVDALQHPVPPRVVSDALCQQVIREQVDLTCLPILTHFAEDGGPYITSGVVVTRDPELGRNLSFHRLMRVGPRSFTARLVEGRGLHAAWQRAKGHLDVAVCIGAPLAVQLAASMSPKPGVDELAIANALAPTPEVRAIGSDLGVPADSEIVLEGYLTAELGDEGPFVDLTRTRDFVRQQPYLVIERITHRQEPIYQALLPGGMEHKLLMGMPREPTIYDAVNKVCTCRNVAITPGGGYWLHAIVQIEKRSPDDGHMAIEQAFRGHSSLKHVIIVDADVDLYDQNQVEWAIATRFQADRDLYTFRDQPSSSLDPSARHVPGQKARTTKMGLDATIHWDTPTSPSRLADYEVVEYAPVDLGQYLKDTGDEPI